MEVYYEVGLVYAYMNGKEDQAIKSMEKYLELSAEGTYRDKAEDLIGMMRDK